MKLVFARFAVLLALVFSFSALVGQAKNYRAMEWDIVRLGLAKFSDREWGGGSALSTEVRYNANNTLSVGLRFEVVGSGTVSGSNINGVRTETKNIKGVGSWVLTADHYLKDNSAHRPFIGLGVGLFTGILSSTTSGRGANLVDEQIIASGQLGFIPRVGMELGHLRASLEYTLITNPQIPHYFALQLAGTLFGGRRGSVE